MEYQNTLILPLNDSALFIKFVLLDNLNNTMKKAFFQLHAAIILASFSGIFGKLITLNEVFITWYRMLLASLILIVIFLCKGGKIKLSKNNIQIAALGFIVGLHWIFFYGSIKYANVSVGVVCFCLSGFFTALHAPLISKTKLSLNELLLSIVTLLGIMLIFHFDSSYRTGIIFGIVSALLFSIFVLFNERINTKNEVVNTTTFQMLGGAIGIGLALPLYLYIYPVSHIVPTPYDFGQLIILALFCTVCMYLLLNRAQKYISAFTINLSYNLEPLYSIILAIILFHENRELTTTFYSGLSLIILSLALQMVRFIVLKKRNTNSL
ncbi:MAG: DMT family transporter [Prevotellaceae bacterium]|jgi:drug/metabolite transporter (DMT)-like permease|nr:DMT family transporter [Prevotellaceae bacterium]